MTAFKSFAFSTLIGIFQSFGGVVAQEQDLARFDSRDYPQIENIELTFEYPADWALVLGKPGGTLVDIGTSVDIVGVVCVFLLEDPGGKLDPAERDQVLSSDGLRAIIPDGAVPIRSFPSVVDGRRTGTIDFYLETINSGVSVRAIMRLVSLIGDDYIFQFGCGVRGLQEDEQDHQMALFDRHAGIFEQIQRSISVAVNVSSAEPK